ncbi:MAG TPA: hypothetical protein VK968_06375, partial [Roseimicrobium sp.]|nr:hypothetical protein [Roseimicrobium sp.]
MYEEAISVNDQQKTGNAASGIEPLWGDGAGSAISGDSRFVVFTSSATNLVSGDTNGKTDVFLRDRTLGTTKLISRPATGQSNGNSYSPTISGDGRTVAFVSEATNLSGEDLPGADIFVYGTWSGVMKQVTSGNAASYHPCLSREGRIVAFTSEASNLVFDDINDLSDVFAYDRLTNATQCVSIAPGGASGPSRRPSISGDKIVFESEATNLVVGDGNDYQDIYLRDLAAQTTTRVSVWGASSLELDGWSYNGVISGDGSKLFFRSAAPDPGSIVGSGYPRFFRRDMVTGATIARYEGTEDIAVSFDGRFVAVVSQSDGDPSSGVHVLDDFGHVASFSVPLPPSHVSLSEDGLNLTYMFQRAVGAFDYNLKKDVALLTVAPQRPIEITTLPSKYVQSNGILGLKSATAR